MFTGLGGMDLGLEAAGFDHLACVEWDDAARRSIKANGREAEWNLLETGDIEKVAKVLTPDDLQLQESELDLLVGAPPCQPYSKAAQWTSSGRKGLGDRRGQYLDDLLVIVERFLPKVVLLENVRGFIHGETSALPHIQTQLEAIERSSGVRYAVDAEVIDAVDHGVPQRRSRAIVVMSRMGRPFEWPAARERRVAWDALVDVAPQADLPVATGKWAGLLPSIPEGQNYLFHTDAGAGKRIFGYRTRYWSFLLKLAKAEPSWTLPAHPGPATGPFHWDNRPLSVAEMLRLQSFPSDWKVEGPGRTDQVRQIGNATPPLLAEVVGRSIATHIEPERCFETVESFAIANAPDRPAPEQPLPVTEARYLDLVGEHAAHPGHGKGPGALAAARATRGA
jgi:DNA (cytosine-5)-methyltransferase 1